ncbi:MAG: Fic family protein, partial [Mariprofundaceae bacterium]|nr:Fic family protein [Mariprofundaceae bacterium]
HYGKFPPEKLEWERVPLSQRVILETHAILMDSVRGHGKSPGRYRRIPNWIGPKGCTQEEARFMPISADKLLEGMGAFERYIHAGNTPDKLVQLAILHAEFEALDWMFARPIFKSSDFVASSGIPAPTARRLLALFRENGLLKPLVEASGRKSAVYAFPALLNIAEGRMAF